MPLPNLGALSLRAPSTGEFWGFQFRDYEGPWEQTERTDDKEPEDRTPTCPITCEDVPVDNGWVDVVPRDDGTIGFAPDTQVTFRIRLTNGKFEWYDAASLARWARKAIEDKGQWPESPITKLRLRPSDLLQLLMVYPTERDQVGGIRALYKKLIRLMKPFYAPLNKENPYTNADDVVTKQMVDVVRDIHQAIIAGLQEAEDSEDSEASEYEDAPEADEEDVGVDTVESVMAEWRDRTNHNELLSQSIFRSRNAHPNVSRVELTALLQMGADPTTASSIERNTVAHVAARDGLAELLALALRQGGNVNAQNRYGMTPLMFALMGNRLDVVSMLIAAGSDLTLENDTGSSVLHFVVEEDAFYLLMAATPPPDLEARNSQGYTPLHGAAISRPIEILEGLVSAGANTNAVNGYGETPLHIAVERRPLNCVKALIVERTNVDIQDAEGNTALHLAVSLHEADEAMELVEELIAANANPHLRDRPEPPDEEGRVGNTPLQVAYDHFGTSREVAVVAELEDYVASWAPRE